MPSPRSARSSSGAHRDDVAALEADLAADDAARLLQQAHQRQRGDALAGARLADDAERLAGGDREADAVDRAHDAGVGEELRAQIAHFEDRRAGGAARARSAGTVASHAQRRRDLGSSQSRMPSPRKLKPSTTVRMAKPGKRRDPPLLDQLAALRHHRAPFRRRRHDAEAEERQAREGDDGVADVERDQHDQRADRIRHDVAQQDARRAEADHHAPPRHIPASAARAPGCARGARISATTRPAWR